MELVLVMASMTVLMMVLAFLTLTREDREIVQEQLASGQDRPLETVTLASSQ